MLETAGCTKLDTCGASASAGSGGSAGAGGTSGTGGTDCSSASAGSAGAPATCDQLTALNACLSAFCKADGAGTPFCGCFLKGYDLSPAGGTPDCACIAFDTPGAFSPSAYCAQAAAVGAMPSDIDCAATTSPLVSMCVGVQ